MKDVTKYGLCGKWSVSDTTIKKIRKWVDFMRYREETGQGKYPSVPPSQTIYPIRNTTNAKVAGRFYKCET